MSKAGLWPREKPRPTESNAEIRLYEAFASDLPSNWTVWHSLRIRTDEGMEGEGDFVIAIPDRGFLVLEVKGGYISVRDGRWFQNSKPLDHSPREQAHSFAKKLLSRLPSVNGMTVPYGILTIFPDTPSSDAPVQDNLRDLVLTEVDVRYLKDAITAKLDKAFPEGFQVPACNWQAQLHALWGETWIPKVHLGHNKTINAEERYQLDQHQVEIVESLSGNKRLLIEGVAGSGKTVMAREAAIRMAAEGQKVQILCFTDALAKWLEVSLSGTGVQVATVPRYAAELMISLGQVKTLPSDPATWAEISLKAAFDALPLLQERPDVVIVDEAQDLAENDWLLIEELAKDAKVWIFRDPAQAFWEERRLPEWVGELSNYRLNKCYRCPEPIMEYSKALSQQPHDEGLVKDGFAREIIGTVECPSESSIPAKIENEIRKLLSRGFKPGDIAVLSLRGRSAESVAGQDKIGSFPVVRADSPDIDENIVADTFLRFKGLERPAIIVTDLRLVKDRFDVRMHIALSRALDVVRVVGKVEP
jgi:hypothetical protein